MLLHIAFLFVIYLASKEDFNTHIVSDKIHVAIIVLGLLRFCLPVSVVGMVITGVPIFLTALFSNGKIGGGDMKFMGAVGFYLGASRGITALIIGLFLAVLYGFIINKKSRNEPLPLIPFLGIGSMMALLI